MKVLFFLLFALTLNAQSVNSLVNLESVSFSSFSANNVWIGSKFLFSIVGDVKNNKDNFLWNTNVIYDASKGRLHFPIVGNFSLPTINTNSIVSNSQGVSIGVYPFYQINTNVTLHGGGLLKTIPSEVSLQQYKAFVGLEVYYFLDKLPITTSVTVARSWNNIESDFFSVEVDGVIPINNGLGILGSYNSYKSLVLVGIITKIK